MKTLHSSFTLAAALTLIAGGAQAQAPGRFSLEVSAGGALPTQDLGDHELKDAGLGLGLNASYRVMPHLAVYAGWDWYHFELEEGIGDFVDVEDTGYAFGVRYDGPTLAMATPWIRAGGVFKHVELETDENDAVRSSDHTLGWEAGVGATLNLGSRWALMPGVRYRTFSPELEELGGEVEHAYVTFDLGFSAAFGGR